MIRLIKEMIAQIFKIETYYDLTIYLLDENKKLKTEVDDLKMYIKLITACDEDEIDINSLEDVEYETN